MQYLGPYQPSPYSPRLMYRTPYYGYGGYGYGYSGGYGCDYGVLGRTPWDTFQQMETNYQLDRIGDALEGY